MSLAHRGAAYTLSLVFSLVYGYKAAPATESNGLFRDRCPCRIERYRSSANAAALERSCESRGPMRPLRLTIGAIMDVNQSREWVQ